MKTSRTNALFLAIVALPVAMALVFSSVSGVAQEQSNDDAQPRAERRQRAQPRGRLPNYYIQVVSPEQREKIYAIQKKHRPQIQELQQQLRALQAKQREEIEVILTPDQLAKVKKLEDEARAQRAKAAAERRALLEKAERDAKESESN